MSADLIDLDVVNVDGHTAICDGLGGALGHPRVFLALDAETHSVVCPYCSRKFVQAHISHVA